MTRKFRYADKTVKQRQYAFLLVGGALSLLFPASVIIAEPQLLQMHPTITLVSFVVFSVLTIASFAVLSLANAKKWREIEVRMLNDRIERQAARAVDAIPYTSIKEILIQKGRSGQVVRVSVCASSTTMNLYGLDRMDTILQSIKQVAPPTAAIKESRSVFRWSSPLAALCISVISLLVVSLVFIAMKELKQDAVNLLVALFFFAVGVWLTFRRSLSRKGGAVLKSPEVILGAVLVILGVLIGTAMLLR